jgi:hypothetical protein
MKISMLICTFLLLFGAPLAAAESLPIVEIRNVVPNQSVFKDARRDKPLVLQSEKDTAKYFGDKALKSLKKQVDFEKRKVLVFAWRGSGGDRLSFEVAKSRFEPVTFRILPGRTRDLGQHLRVFSLRAKGKWSVAK